MPTDAHLYKIRDKRRFLIAAMQELAGNARISFEGDLSATAVAHLVGASVDETEILKRNTLWPKQDFVVLPLEADLVGAIIAAVGGTVPRGMLHVQIEKGNRLELGLYDNCAPKVTDVDLLCELARRRDHLAMDGTLTPAKSEFRQIRGPTTCPDGRSCRQPRFTHF